MLVTSTGYENRRISLPYLLDAARNESTQMLESPNDGVYYLRVATWQAFGSAVIYPNHASFTLPGFIRTQAVPLKERVSTSIL